jgi:hypothetical protein
MKKFECKKCESGCKLEIDEENPNPTHCIYNGYGDWQEVKEETEAKEEVKGIIRDIPKWIIDGIFYEYHWACEKHPKFPNNEFEMMCVIQEELGEAIQALNNLKHHQQGVINDINIELLHTIVTCLRTLMAINEKEKY